MSIPKPQPLYPSQSEFEYLTPDDYAHLQALFKDSEGWVKQHWLWGKDFLKFISRNKSEHTFTRFRGETERFLIWAFFVKQKPVDTLRKTDILQYADFLWKPPESWICTNNYDKFQLSNGHFIVNEKWRPFRLSSPKHQEKHDTDIDKRKYRPSQQTLTASFTGIIAFYNYLIGEELAYANPAQLAKKDCRYFIKDAQVKEVRRLNESQWQYVLDVVTALADSDDKYERSLFVIAALKTLFLRISELSERRTWSPLSSHFWEDDDGNWWLKIYGKGRKLRDTTVPPKFIPYLKRYRQYRGLPPLPSPSENFPLVEKIRGSGGMTSRHLSRLVQEIFDFAYEKMNQKEGEDKARKLREASTHWLRHTGASMEIERGRALKDLSEDLGHASMATTDTVYVQTENKRRAESGKNRKVD
ncbi:MAG: site-specific integrase [Agarilytica sp.]